MTSLILQGDALNLPLPDESVDLIVTSPPYFALRSYRDDGEHYEGQIGSEPTPDAFLDALDKAMVEMGRVLKGSGSVFVNLGDKYVSSNKGGGWRKSGDSPAQLEGSWGTGGKGKGETLDIGEDAGMGRTKSLMGLPWRFAIRQIDAGWILRAELIWSKPNGLPESVTDRVRRSHEQWFHFVKEPRYFSAVDEIREPHAPASTERFKGPARVTKATADNADKQNAAVNWAGYEISGNPLGRLPGSVWTIPTEPLKVPDQFVDHFAAFPQEWPRKFILGWSPSGICVECGEGRRPVVDSEKRVFYGTDEHVPGAEQVANDAAQKGYIQPNKWRSETRLTGYQCACPTPDAPTRPAVILDVFGGTGTVAGVARKLGRIGISLDLSMDYSRLAKWRVFESGHFDKTLKRTMNDKQGTLL